MSVRVNLRYAIEKWTNVLGNLSMKIEEKKTRIFIIKKILKLKKKIVYLKFILFLPIFLILEDFGSFNAFWHLF